MWQQAEAWQAGTLPDHVAQLLRAIQRLLPRPACVLAGVGCGAAVAHELGVQLQSAGVEVGGGAQGCVPARALGVGRLDSSGAASGLPRDGTSRDLSLLAIWPIITVARSMGRRLVIICSGSKPSLPMVCCTGGVLN